MNQITFPSGNNLRIEDILGEGVKKMDKERIEVIKHIHNQDEKIHEFDIDWLIEQAEKVERYEKALTKISTRKMSTYLTVSHMNRDFIKISNDALNNIQ